MRIHFALELPTVALESLNELADFDFAIAYRVLADAAYAKHYCQRPTGRKLVLDNGFHELGKPAGWPELLEAAHRVQPDFIIVPDNSGPYDAADNLLELQRAIDFMVPERLALVVAGRTDAEREMMVQSALDVGVGVLCFSRMVPRLAWFHDLVRALPMVEQQRIHLLGVSTLEELQAWRGTDARHLSVDTSKPAKAALLGRTLSSDVPLRGMPIVSKTLFEQPMDRAVLNLCRTNIASLREACGG